MARIIPTRFNCSFCGAMYPTLRQAERCKNAKTVFGPDLQIGTLVRLKRHKKSRLPYGLGIVAGRGKTGNYKLSGMIKGNWVHSFGYKIYWFGEDLSAGWGFILEMLGFWEFDEIKNPQEFLRDLEQEETETSSVLKELLREVADSGKEKDGHWVIEAEYEALRFFKRLCQRGRKITKVNLNSPKRRCIRRC